MGRQTGMKTGFRGTFVISWAQTELDGVMAPPMSDLRTGAGWRWQGEAVRVDGASGVLPLGAALGEEELRARAARGVRRLLRAVEAEAPDPTAVDAPDDPLFEDTFVVTDGRDTWTVTVIASAGPRPLCMFVGEIPPRDCDLWVVRSDIGGPLAADRRGRKGGMICFTPGTVISTPEGPRRVEQLIEGDLVDTADDGPQEIVWIGSRRVTGARMVAMPDLCPVRLMPGALGDGVPDDGLLVSPDHKVVVEGALARTLFNDSEVLATARDLVDGSTIRIDRTLREVRYIHVLLPHHAIVFANGMKTESFHPASCDASALAAFERERLHDRMPELRENAMAYGAYARRTLSGAEAAILRHEAA